MKANDRKRRKKAVSPSLSAKASRSSPAISRRASIFRNGTNQAVRLPQDLRFSSDVKEVRIRRKGDGLLISPMKPSWQTFFRTPSEAPEDFLVDRNQSPSQSREPL